MKKFDVVQNTPEWHKARCGKATASMFDKIITPAKAEPSKQAADYENQIVAEIITGEPVDEFKGTVWTDRGHELEPEAIAAYAMLREGAEVEHGCFVSNDEETYGASPDNFVKISQYVTDVNDDWSDLEKEDKRRLVGYEEGLLEIKCFMPKNQVSMLLDPHPDRAHYPQLQGQLLVTGCKWVDIMFYHPKLPPQIVRVMRDEDYIEKLKTALEVFSENVKTKVNIIKEKF